MRNLVLNGGPHPFDQTTPRLVRMLTDSRIASTVHDDIEEGLDVLSRDPHDLLTVHCLRWTMLQSPKYAPLQATWAYVPSEAAIDIRKEAYREQLRQYATAVERISGRPVTRRCLVFLRARRIVDV